MAFKDEVAAIFNLHAGIDAMQTRAGQAFPSRELRRHNQCPVVDALLDCFTAELVSGFLQKLWIANANKAIIRFGERNILTAQLLFDEVVAVEIGGDLEGQERTHAQDHWASHFVQNVKVLVRVAALVFAQELEVWVRRREFGSDGPKRPALLHALENVIDAEALLSDHALLAGADQILFADPFVRPNQRHLVIGSVMQDPGLILAGSFGQDFLGNFRLFADFPEKIGHIVFAGQKGEVSVNNEAIKTVINPLQIRVEQFMKALHWRSFF